MARCLICGTESPLVASSLGACGPCLRENSARSRELAQTAHARVRAAFGQPPSAPRHEARPACRLCVNACQPAIGKSGLCALRQGTSTSLRSLAGTPRRGAVDWYHDPLPTNCCADWVCPGGSGAGYPKFSHSPHAERGYKNLAVFYYGCSFDCLYCQNWQCRRTDLFGEYKSSKELALAVDARTSCICYFGGDPTPQLPHAIHASRLARARAQREKRILRICWETNGSMHPSLLRQMTELSLESGGCIKFDLKAWHEPLHEALCGATNKRTLENFAYVAERTSERPEVPLLVAATLLVPGYVDVEEVGPLARFIASLDPSIPYVLLAFHPCFQMSDLPPTSRSHAERCLAAARDAGLTKVRVGNLHLLSSEYQ